MMHSGGKMYLAKKDGHMIGVFSTPEQAAQTEYDELTEIKPMLREGSPASGKYVFLAQGTWTTLTRINGKFVSESVQLEAWGMNPQSAVYGLSAPAVHRQKGVEVDALYMLETNRTYAREEKRDFPFAALSACAEKNSPYDVDFSVDYVEKYFDGQRKEREREERHRCAAMDVLIASSMNGIREEFEQRIGEALTAQECGELEDQMRRRLSYMFEMHELETLACMVQQQPCEENDGLRERYAECIRCLRRRYALKYRSIRHMN